MAPLRQACLAVLAVLLLSALAVYPALGARTHAHRALRCHRSTALRGKSSSFHAGHAAPRSKHHRAGCFGGRHHAKALHPHKTVHRHRPGSHTGPARRHTRSSAADNGACAEADLRPSVFDIAQVRAATLCLINRERAAQGEGALQENSRLQGAAQAHTESMAWGDYFEHSGPGGQTLVDRMRSTGYLYSSNLGYEVGENIAWGTGSLGTPRAIVAAWMGSSGHRANILDGRFRDTAIGVSPHPPASLAHGQSGGIYTQDFGVITGGG